MEDMMMDDLSQGDICRVCRCEGQSDRPLFHPCICMGSIKFIHQDCLTQWMRYSRKEYCELCGHRFSFIPIYSPDMPRMLPLKDVVCGLLKSIGRAVKSYLHYTLVAIAWLGVVPLYAYRMYRSLFSDSLENFFSLPLNLFSTENIPWDIFKGVIVVSCTIFVTIGLIWLREQILHGGGPDWLEREDNNNNNLNVDLNNLEGNDIFGGGDNAANVDPERRNNPENNLQQPEEPLNPINHLDNEINENFLNENPVNGNGNLEEDANNPRNDDVNWNPMEWDRDEITWERLLGLDGSMVFLEHVFWVISLNTVCILIFAFGPYKIGNILISTMGLFHPEKKLLHFHGFLTAIVGYCVIGIVLLKLHAIARILKMRRLRRILGISYIVVKVSLMLIAEIGLLPLVCGLWLDVCSLPLFDVSIKDRQASFRAAPGTSLFIHWLFGIIYVYYFATFLDLLREVLRPGVLWFLRNVNDPDYSSLQEKIHLSILKLTRRIIVSTIIYVTTITLILWVPIKFIKELWPSFLPYTLSRDSEFNELTLQFLLLHVLLPGFYEQTRARVWLRALIKLWCSAVSKVLGIRSYLLGNEEPENEENQALGEENRNGENNEGNGENRAGMNAFMQRDVPLGFQPYTRPSFFGVRIVGLLICICITLVIGSFLNLTVPVFIGRRWMSVYTWGRPVGVSNNSTAPIGAAFNHHYDEKSTYEWLREILSKVVTYQSSKPHELYTAILGAYFCWVLARIVAIAVNILPLGRQAIVQRIRNCFAVAASYAMAAVIVILMFGVVPLLYGLLLELVVVVPLRVPVEQTPILFLVQDWTLGVLYTKITCALTMMGPDWRLKRAIERAYQDGVRNINFSFIMKELAIPVITFFGLALAIPYAIAHSIVPIFVTDIYTKLLISRRIYPFFLLIAILILFMNFTVIRFKKLYEAIKNDKYLVGQRLVNYEHQRKRRAEEAEANSRLLQN